jgi:hypothetical protein
VGLEADIRTALLAMNAVTAIVGTGDSARIYPDVFDENCTTLPAILVEVDSEDPQNDIDGRGGLRIGLATLTCRATTRQGSRALAEAVLGNGANPHAGLRCYAGSGWDIDTTNSLVTAAVPKGMGTQTYYWDTVIEFGTSATETT